MSNGLRFVLALNALEPAMSVGEAAAQAGVQSARDIVVYQPDFFAPFAPQSALDMVERVPGFVVEEADEDQRGLSSAAGNVLIDGAEPAAKSQSIEDILNRIPAGDVVRIELLRGGGGAASAQTTRVNVVRQVSDGEGAWRASLSGAEDSRISPSGEASWSARLGAGDYSISVTLDHEHEPMRGLRRDYDASGELEETRTEVLPSDDREYGVAGEWRAPLVGGEFGFTGQVSRADAREQEVVETFAPAGASTGAETADGREREDVFELGAAYSRELAEWTVEAAALVTRRRFESDEISQDYEADGARDGLERQTQNLESGETIVRLSAARELGARLSLELGAEAALNTLEQRLALSVDEGAGPVPVVLPSANVRVEEERSEIFATLAGPLGVRWMYEASAALETSTLSQSGDSTRVTDLTYWKPSLQLTRPLGSDSQVRFRAYRDVGQLDFEDFVSAADVRDAQIDAGNPDLRPEKSWRLEAGSDWRFGGDGALNLALYHWRVEDALDIVPVGPVDDQLNAPGNIGDANVSGLRLALTLPLPASFEFRVEGFAQRSRARDPLTAERRSLSEFQESALELGLRQDVSAWRLAWGVDYERETYAPSYRLDQVEREQEAGNLGLWIETTAIDGVKLRAWASRLNGEDEIRTRRFFAPDRRGAADGSDARRREEGRYVGIELSGAF